MIVIGIDVAVLAAIGLMCILLVMACCAMAGMQEDIGELVTMSSCFTVLFMLVGYLIMARVLDVIVLNM